MAAVFGFGIGFQFYKKGLALVGPVATAATSVTGTSFVANWNTYDGATTYYLDVSISSSFSTFVLQNQSVSAPTTSYTVTGLTACTTYYYRVRAEGVVPTISVAPTLSPSGSQITGTVITCGTGTWSSQGSIFNYKWKRNGVAITGATSNTYTIQAIDAGTTITCDVQNQNAFGKSAYVGTSNSVSATAVDPDAQAFFDRVTTAGGSLSATEKTAVNTLVLDLKSYSIWSKMKAIYPMVGASAAACAQNLKSSSFTGTFSGGWTYASTGVNGNGTNAYMNTNFIPSSDYTSNTNFGLFLYTSSTSAGSTDRDMAIFTSAGTPSLNLTSKDGTSSKTDLFDFANRISVTGYNVEGFYIGSRTASNSAKLYRNGTSIGTTTAAAGTAPSIFLTLGGGNLSSSNPITSVGAYSAKTFSFAGTCDGLTDTEASNFYIAVQAFQTTLSRNV
jgi:hypothetical protein